VLLFIATEWPKKISTLPKLYKISKITFDENFVNNIKFIKI